MAHSMRRRLPRHSSGVGSADIRGALCVEDTGPDIQPEQLNDIFDAFVTTKLQGMGLGLAIAGQLSKATVGN